MRRFPLWPVVLGRPGCRRQPGSRALATRGGDDARREYRYVIDHVGRVHLADSKHTSVATAVNDTQFLDLLYRGMKRGAEPGAVWTQPCQGEVNTLSLLAEGARDAIVVFHSLDADNLRFAGTMCVRFDPEAVGVCGGGFMYHLLPKASVRPPRRRRRCFLPPPRSPLPPHPPERTPQMGRGRPHRGAGSAHAERVPAGR